MPRFPHNTSLLIIFLTVFIDLLGFGMVLPLLPIYADQFHADTSGWLIGGLMASFSLMQFIFAPLWGRLSDHIGRRPVLMVGLAGSVVFYSLFGVATVMVSLPLLFAARIGAGIAGATISTAQAYIADSTSLTERPKGMALIGMAFGLGFTFGPLLGYLAVPGGREAAPGPAPGFVAAGLSAFALLLAFFRLPESLRPDGRSTSRKILDLSALRDALATPSITPLLATIFVCVFAFANFETTLSMLIRGARAADSPFKFSWGQVCLTFAYIGFTLALVQGGLVRRLAGRINEAALAAAGAVAEVVGFGLIVAAIATESSGLLLGSLAVVVGGFAFMTPSLNSLLSRRTDPAKQGGILGVGQSVNAMARILGSLVGIPLLKIQNTLPFYLAAAMMAAAVLLVMLAARAGKDFPAKAA